MSAEVISVFDETHGWLFAAFDPDALNVQAKVAHCKLGAFLAPYPDEASARVALDSVKAGTE